MILLLAEAFAPKGRSYVVNDTRESPQTRQIVAQEDARRPFGVLFPNQRAAQAGLKLLLQQMRDPETRHHLVNPIPGLQRRANHFTPHEIRILGHNSVPYHCLAPFSIARKWVTQSEYQTRADALNKAKEWIAANTNQIPVFTGLPPEDQSLVIITPDEPQAEGLFLDPEAWQQLASTQDDHLSFMEYVLHEGAVIVFYGYDEDLDRAFELHPEVLKIYAAQRSFPEAAKYVEQHHKRDAGWHMESLARVQLKVFSNRTSSRKALRVLLEQAHRWCAMNGLRPSHRARSSWIRRSLEEKQRHKFKHGELDDPHPQPARYHVPMRAKVELPNKDRGSAKLIVSTRDSDFLYGHERIDDFAAWLEDEETIPRDMAHRVVATFDGRSFYHESDPFHKLLRAKLTKIQNHQLADLVSNGCLL